MNKMILGFFKFFSMQLLLFSAKTPIPGDEIITAVHILLICFLSTNCNKF